MIQVMLNFEAQKPKAVYRLLIHLAHLVSADSHP
jgi:hypothetical protein